MTKNERSGVRGQWLKGVIAIGVLSGLLGGCASGQAQAERADEAFVEVEYVVDASTEVRRPGIPTNRLFVTYLTFVEGVTQEQQAQALDDVLVIARDELGAVANVGVRVFVDDGYQAFDLEPVVAELGDVGEQSPSDLAEGTLHLTQDQVLAYESVQAD